jgi:AraC family transcriptional regulator
VEKDSPEGRFAAENRPANGEAPDVPPEHVLLSSNGRGWSGVDAAELRSGDLGSRIYAESLANVLAVNLLRRHSSLGRSSARKLEHERASGLPEASLRTALDYVGDNLAEDLTLAEIAREVSMSPYHFSRMFKLSTGFSPHRYVMRQRIERAKVLLKDTDLPVGVVAQEVGFASPSHFAQQFRRLVGVSPRSFR